MVAEEPRVDPATKTMGSAIRGKPDMSTELPANGLPQPAQSVNDLLAGCTSLMARIWSLAAKHHGSTACKQP